MVFLAHASRKQLPSQTPRKQLPSQILGRCIQEHFTTEEEVNYSSTTFHACSAAISILSSNIFINEEYIVDISINNTFYGILSLYINIQIYSRRRRTRLRLTINRFNYLSGIINLISILRQNLEYLNIRSVQIQIFYSIFIQIAESLIY